MAKVYHSTFTDANYCCWDCATSFDISRPEDFIVLKTKEDFQMYGIDENTECDSCGDLLLDE